MACLLIVDDDADNARQLSAALAGDIAGRHDIVCIQGLGDYRRLRRRYKPDLILVELMRHQSNGFTLAAALARQASAPVVLLTDRDVGSDRLWASARGITHVLSRRGGQAALAVQIGELLDTGLLPATDEATIQPPGKVSVSGALSLELSATPEAALLSSLAEELQQLPCAPDRSDTACPGPMRSLGNLLPYISDAEIRTKLQRLVDHSGPQSLMQADSSWLRARENVLALLEPAAGVSLRACCQEEWSELSQLIETDNDWRNKHGARCNQLLHAMTFLPVASARTGDHKAGNTAWVEAVERVLCPINIGEEIKALMDAGCLRLLGSVCSSGQIIDRRVLRDFATLGLVLRTVPGLQHRPPILAECCNALYGWTSPQHCSVIERLVYTTVSLLSSPWKVSPDELDVKVVSEDCLAAESTQKMLQSISGMSHILMGELPLPQRLMMLMVSVYKLRSWLGLGREHDAGVDKAHQGWHLVMGCLYELVCQGVLQPNQLSHADINDLNKLLHELSDCCRNSRLPSPDVVMNLAALELTVARRSQSGSGDHQLLAAGLHRLPRPDGIVPDLLSDIQQSGTVRSEIVHELILLTDGARRLGVPRVESLARLLLDCYQQLTSRPELLQRKPLRIALGRAHRVLCRLLDQAAAWLPLNHGVGGHTLAATINDLFDQFDQPACQTTSRFSGGVVSEGGYGNHVAWTQFQLLNGRLRQLIRRSGNLSEYRSLMIELLREQQALIAPHLRYQSPE